MELPDLPRKNKRQEAKIDSLVGLWFLKNWPRSVMYEVKLWKTGRLSPHQEVIITRVAASGEFHYKHPDLGHKTPLDGFVMKGGDVAVCWMNGHEGVCEINKSYKINIKV